MRTNNKNGTKYGAGNKIEDIKTLNKGFLQGIAWSTVVYGSLFILALILMGAF